MKIQTPKRILIILICLIIGVASATFAADKAGDPETYRRTIESIDRKSQNVMVLSASTALTSVTISAIPDDTATPIADKLADFSEYFLAVLCVLYTEKYLLTLLGTVAFRLMIPLACLLGIRSQFGGGEGFKRLAGRLFLFALVFTLAVPVSMRAADLIYDTYSVSIDETLNAAQTLREKGGAISAANGDQTLLEQAWERIAETATTLANKAANTLNRFTESLAVLLVTSCVIPVLTLIFLLWLVRLLTGVDLNASVAARVHRPRRREEAQLPPHE